MAPQTRAQSLPMGQFAVARSNGVLRTLLGSCLGLALYDRRFKIAALGHIVLPDSLGRSHPAGKFADTAVPAMIRHMQELARVERLSLHAKIAGGANMFAGNDSGSTIGMQNVAAIERILDDMRIPIIGRNCGGELGRRMLLDAATGTVTIDIVGAATMTL